MGGNKPFLAIMAKLAFVPTFKLPRIDPTRVRNLYDQGYFTNAVPPESKIKVTSGACPIVRGYDADTNNGIFTIIDRNGLTTTIATTNQKAFSVVNASGGAAPVTGPCDWCRHECNYEMVGLPFRRDIENVDFKIEGKDGQIKSETRQIRIYWSEVFFCDYECAYAYFERNINSPIRQRDALYNEAEYLLCELFSLQYPGRKLVAAADPKLLDINRGSLTYEQYKSNKYKYYRSPNIVLFPAKREYIQRATI